MYGVYGMCIVCKGCGWYVYGVFVYGMCMCVYGYPAHQVCGLCVLNGTWDWVPAMKLLVQDAKDNGFSGYVLDMELGVLVCSVWCILYGIWNVVIWCVVYGVWCMVYGAWCMVYCLWCMVDVY